LPDQIDQETYGSQFTSNTSCCIFYSASDKTTYDAGWAVSTWTNTSTTQTWTPNTTTVTPNNPIALYSNLTSTVTISEELRIPAGYTVTINNMTLKFSPQARLIIESGKTTGTHAGALIMNNCLLTSDNRCLNDMWPGIQVWGAPAYNHGTAFQGGLTMTTCTITNAYVAVLAGFDTTSWYSNLTPQPPAPLIPSSHYSYTATTGSSYNGGGGFVFATSCTFLNNMRSMVFNDYVPSSSLNGNYANLCNFSVNAALLNSSITPGNFVTLHSHVNLFAIKGSSFYNSYQTNIDTGICSTNSTYTVDINGSTRSTFTSLVYGIYATNTSGNTATIWCKNSTFLNNNYGIYLGYVNNAIMESDTFKLYITTCLIKCVKPNSYGIYLDNCTGYYVQDNDFTRYSINPTNHLYGVLVNNSGPHVNGIFRNTFDHLYEGSQAQYINYYYPGGGVANGAGLLYLCNIFASGTISNADIYVPAYNSTANVGGTCSSCTVTAGIEYNQGASGAGSGPNRVTADNQFSHTAGANDFFIEAPGTGTVNPYTYPSNYLFYCPAGTGTATCISSTYTSSVYKPYNTNTSSSQLILSTVTLTAVPTCTAGGTGHRTANINPITQALSDAAGAKQVYDSLRALVDAGSTSGLLNLVSGNNNAQAVYNSLNAAAPYISDDVLKAYLKSNYPTSDIRQILIACSPLSNGVNNAINASNLSAGIKTQLNIYQTGPAKIDQLYDGISSAATTRQLSLDEALRILVRINQPDTIAITKALLKEQAMELPARAQVETGLNIQDTAMVQNALAQVMAQEGQSNYVKLSNILLQNMGKSAEQIMKNPGNLNQMLAFDKDSTDRLTYLKANVLLQAVRKSDYVPYIQDANSNSVTNAAQAQRVAAQIETPAIQSESTLFNSPNPFKESTTVKANIVEKTQNAYILITDMVGSELARYPVQQGDNSINVNAGGLAQTVMFCTLVVDGVKIKTNKMVLIK
jgi:hypothetical protein